MFFFLILTLTIMLMLNININIIFLTMFWKCVITDSPYFDLTCGRQWFCNADIDNLKMSKYCPGWCLVHLYKIHTYCVCHPSLRDFCAKECHVCKWQRWVKVEWRWKGYCYPLPWQPVSPQPRTAPPQAPTDSSSAPLPHCRQVQDEAPTSVCEGIHRNTHRSGSEVTR